MSGVELTLYSTDSCTLCEQALDVLLSMPELGAQKLTVVDIASDDDLLQRLGERIPVLRLSRGSQITLLDWPFDASAIVDSIAQLK